MIFRVCVRELLRSGLAIVAALLLSFFLVQSGPGFGVDERELDVRLNDESRAAIRQSHPTPGTATALAAFVRHAATGDFGVSSTYGRPVAEMITERMGESLPALAIAWLLTTALALWAALAAAVRRGTGTLFAGTGALVLAIPCAVLALLFAWLKLPIAVALVIAVLPQAYRYAAGVLAGAAARPSVLAARSRGIRGPALWLRHIVLPAAPELLGVTSLTANLLIGASIPIEALMGGSGLGRLVYDAALGRDLALIAAMTLLVAIATLAAGSCAEIGAAVLRARRLS